jgi:hypothetical protein
MSPRYTWFVAAVALGTGGHACSCFGPYTFCQTLSPPYPQPEYWVPSDIVLAVKVSDFAYSANLQIVQAFTGNLQQGEEIRVWGDCGLLCRQYVSGVNDGDTVLWALQHCDLAGNVSCGTSLESPQDYQLSICGVYSLAFQNNFIYGPLTQAGATQQIPLEDFITLVNGCLITGAPQVETTDPVTLWTDGTGLWLSLAPGGPAQVEVHDSMGRYCLGGPWGGSPKHLAGLSAGTYVVSVRREAEVWRKKVVVK